MAFVKIDKTSTGAGALQNVVRMGWHLQSKEHKTRSVYFAVSRDVIDKVGWVVETTSVKDKTSARYYTRVTIHEGTGNDAGFLLMEQDPKGYTLGNNKASENTNAAFTMNLSATRFKHYAINDAIIEKDPEEVEFTIDENDHTILLQVPDWMRYNPTPEPLMEYVEPPPSPPTKPKPKMPLNREQRRRLAKEVVNELGKH